MTNVYCVRADGGTYTKHFLKGGYAGIGWIDDVDLSQITSDDALYPIYKKAHPADKSKLVIGQQVKQIARFLLVIKAGDYVLTPAAIQNGCTMERLRQIPHIIMLPVMMAVAIITVATSNGQRIG